MIDNQETQEKIAAEVRDLSKFVRNKVELGEYIDVPMPTAFGKPLDVYYAELADRIEAAAKREPVTNCNQLGNAVKVHKFNAEKLGVPFYVDVGTSIVAVRCTCNHEVVWSADHVWSGKGQIDEARRICAIMNEATKHPIGNAAAMREALEAARDLLLPQCNGGTAFAKTCGETVNKIMDALAAPPRNCDRYATHDKAAEAFTRLKKLPEVLPDGNDDELMREWLCSFVKWLFLENKKGDDDGSK